VLLVALKGLLSLDSLFELSLTDWLAAPATRSIQQIPKPSSAAQFDPLRGALGRVPQRISRP
jgi:hypothetical protein